MDCKPNMTHRPFNSEFSLLSTDPGREQSESKMFIEYNGIKLNLERWVQFGQGWERKAFFQVLEHVIHIVPSATSTSLPPPHHFA